MTTPTNHALHANVLRQAEQRASARTAARDEAVSAVGEQLLPQVHKIAADVVQTLLGEERDLEAFRGRVAIHAAGAEIARAKQSMQDGFCWDCGIEKFSSRSLYRRCAACDTKDP